MLFYPKYGHLHDDNPLLKKFRPPTERERIDAGCQCATEHLKLGIYTGAIIKQISVYDSEHTEPDVEKMISEALGDNHHWLSFPNVLLKITEYQENNDDHSFIGPEPKVPQAPEEWMEQYYRQFMQGYTQTLKAEYDRVISTMEPFTA